jgi:hypothetical protein
LQIRYPAAHGPGSWRIEMQLSQDGHPEIQPPASHYARAWNVAAWLLSHVLWDVSTTTHVKLVILSRRKSFLSRLSTELHDIPHKIKPLPWSGENSIVVRDKAAHVLAEHLSAEHTEQPQATQLVIAIVTVAISHSVPFIICKSVKLRSYARRNVQIHLS